MATAPAGAPPAASPSGAPPAAQDGVWVAAPDGTWVYRQGYGPGEKDENEWRASGKPGGPWTDPSSGVTYQQSTVYPDGSRIIPQAKGMPHAIYVNPDGTTVSASKSVDSSLGGAIKSAVGGVVNKLPGVKTVTNKLGLTHDAPPSPGDSADAQSARDFAGKLREQMDAPGPAAPVIDQTQSNQMRDTANANIADLQGVANGTTRTAADSLYQQGTDEAAARARGLAAAYSRSNPGAALRVGVAAGNQAQAAATSGAGILKANEQAQARGQIGTFADAVRAQDTANAKANQDATLTQEQLDNQRKLGLGGLAATETNAPLAADIANQNAIVANNKANAEGTGSFYSGAGSLLTMLSDKRAKTNMRPRSLADAYAEKVHGVTYDYKPGEGDGGTHDGVLAQDVEKVTPGAVKADARGMKTIDVGHMTMANTSALAEIAKRLRKLEGRKRA